MRGMLGFVAVNAILALANVVAVGVIWVLADLAAATYPQAAATMPAYLAIGMTGVACAVLFVVGAIEAVRRHLPKARRIRPCAAS